jgi:hypothetical protein
MSMATTDRANPFKDIGSLPVFEPKPQPSTPVATDQIERIAKENNFPSRQPAKVKARPPRRIARHRTGRNQQFNIKATAQVIERFYKLADDRRVPLGELLEKALDALEGVGAGDRLSGS